MGVEVFLRGHHPILMDFGIIDVVRLFDPSLGVPSYESFEPARYAMGDTLRFAQRMKLAEMEPHDNLSSTGYVLARRSGQRGGRGVVLDRPRTSSHRSHTGFIS